MWSKKLVFEIFFIIKIGMPIMHDLLYLAHDLDLRFKLIINLNWKSMTRSSSTLYITLYSFYANLILLKLDQTFFSFLNKKTIDWLYFCLALIYTCHKHLFYPLTLSTNLLDFFLNLKYNKLNNSNFFEELSAVVYIKY